MTKVFVRAIGILGRQSRIFDKYYESTKPITNFEVERNYIQIENFLKKNYTPFVNTQINPFPHLEEGIITGPNLGSMYFSNNCIVVNCFESGNGFNFEGVYQCLVSVASTEEEILKNFEILKRV